MSLTWINLPISKGLHIQFCNVHVAAHVAAELGLKKQNKTKPPKSI